MTLPLSGLRSTFQTIENNLEKASKVAIIGSIPAILLVVVGAIKAAVGAFFALLGALFSCTERGYEYLLSGKHLFTSGVEDIIFGTILVFFGSCAKCWLPKYLDCRSRCC